MEFVFADDSTTWRIQNGFNDHEYLYIELLLWEFIRESCRQYSHAHHDENRYLHLARALPAL